jgi:SulP family sulfate permease
VDIDAAVSAWDDAVLARTDLAPAQVDRWLAQALPSPDMLVSLLGYFESITLAPGDRLFAQGEASNTLYFVQSGRLITLVESAAGLRTIRTVTPGGCVGEMGLFRDMPRSAHVQAEQPSSLHRDRLEAMERERPDLAAAVYRLFVHKLADRLEQSTSQLSALLR